jgi:hypothetical protein
MSFNKYHDYQYLFLDKKKKKREKNHIMLNFPVRCTSYRLVHIYKRSGGGGSFFFFFLSQIYTYFFLRH